MLEIFEKYYNFVGMTGVVLLLIAYYLLNINRLSSTSLSYLWLNLLGAACILFSLMFDWNLSSVLIELAWILISLVGIYRVMRGSKKPRAANLYVLKKAEKSEKMGS